MPTTLEPRVVVFVTPTYETHRTRGLVAARFLQLGLTTYGQSRPEALEALKELFTIFIEDLRKYGRLEDHLNAIGVRWVWESDYQSWVPDDEVRHQPEVALAMRERPAA